MFELYILRPPYHFPLNITISKQKSLEYLFVFATYVGKKSIRKNYRLKVIALKNQTSGKNVIERIPGNKFI